MKQSFQVAFSTFIFLLLFVVFPQKTWGQDWHALKIKVVDSISGEPLFGATISAAKHRHYHISDEQGMSFIDSLFGNECLLHVSYIGYHHFDAKIKLPLKETFVVKLCAETNHLHESLVIDKGHSSGFNNGMSHYLSVDEISARQGQSISNLLKNMNGITLMNSAGGISKPVVRGLHGQRVVMLQGNARMEGQQWGDDHGVELDPFQTNGVDLIKGSAAIEYGPEAIGGVIRVLPRPWKAANGIGGTINLQGFSNNLQGASSLMLEGRVGGEKYFAWRANASIRKAGDAHAPTYNISNTGFEENNQSFNMVFGNKKWIWETGISRYATTQGIFIGSHLGNITDLNKALQSPEPLIILPFTYAIGRPYQQVEHILLTTQWSVQISPKSKFKWQYTQQVNRRKEYDADRLYNQALKGKPAMDLEIQSFSMEQTYERKFRDHWAFKLGASEMYQNNTVAGLQFIIPTFQSWSVGTYSLIRKEWIDASLSFGLRYDVRQLNVPRFTRYQKSYAYERFFNGATAGLTYTKKFEHNYLLAASLQTGWRPPAVNELYSYGLHYGVASFEIGDSLLVPERSFMLDISVKKNSNFWFFELNGFAQLFNDFIYKNPLADPILTIRGAFPAFQFTQQNASLIGSEASASYSPNTAWQWEGKLSYLYAQNLGSNQPLLWMPANRMEHILGYNFKDTKSLKATSIELQSIWVAKQNRYVPGVDYIDPPKGYALINFNVGTSFRPYSSSKLWLLHFSFQNVLNQSYRDYQSRFRYFTNDPGFNFIINLQIPF
jgi:iron complex outermembrane receptor protein